MSASSSSSVFLMFVFFLLLLIIISTPCCSSWNTNKLPPSPVLFPLTHSLSNSKLKTNIHHLLKSTTTTSTARFLNHHRQFSVALSPGTDYTLSFSLGSSSSSSSKNNNTTATLYMDTGSDTVWLPCKPFTCILCEGKSDPKTTPPPLNLSSSSASPVTCQSPACSSVHSNLPTSHLCAMARCPLESIEMSECNSSCPPFYYAYGDGSFVGRLYSDTLQMPPFLKIHNFTFGCAHEALAEPIGVAGFGRGPLSLPAQLAQLSPHLGNQFSYCLVSHSFDTDRIRQPSPLILGRRVDSSSLPNESSKLKRLDDFAYTPMLHNWKHPYYYYVGLEAITVGNRRLRAPANMNTIDAKGNGGMVVDSGTTYTILPEEFYNSVVSEFGKGLDSGYERADSVEDRTGLSPCYYTTNKTGFVPKLVLHFGRNSSVVMPKRNYFYEFIDENRVKRKVGCMTLMNGGYFPDSGGPAGLLGNYQQQGLEVVYDLLNNRVGFARRKCSSLWDTIR